MVQVSELLFFNFEEKVVHVEVGWANFQLPIQVKQLKNRPGMAENKLLFQMVLLWEKYGNMLLVLLSKLATSRLIYSLIHFLES